jgi:hypothetical protein
MNRLWEGLALLGSSATLVCCVIPALLVTLGFGATLAGAVSAFPQLTLLSENKAAVFAIAGLLLLATGYARSRPEAQSCPADPRLAEACRRSKKWGSFLFITASILYTGSLFFVFVLPQIIG